MATVTVRNNYNNRPSLHAKACFLSLSNSGGSQQPLSIDDPTGRKAKQVSNRNAATA